VLLPKNLEKNTTNNVVCSEQLVLHILRVALYVKPSAQLKQN